MDLSLTPSQEMLRASARSFVEREAPRHALVAAQKDGARLGRELWDKASELGWPGMLVPAEHGGSEASLTDAAVLFEELGRGPVPGPFFSSGVLGALTVLEAGSPAQRRALLPRVATGEIVLTVAITEPNASWGPQGVTLPLKRHGDRYRLDGVKLFVADATQATHLIVAARAGDDSRDGLGLVLVDAAAPGVTVRRLPGFLSWRDEVVLDGVEAPASDLLGEPGQDGWAALLRALVRAWPVLCSFMVGGCQTVFEMSVTHSRERVQFGVPIGRFQRVQDHVIRLVNHLDAARWTTAEALWKLDTGRPATDAVHLAKAVASEAYLEACNAAHEVHAGQGSLTEYGLAAHTQMSRTLFSYLGDPRWHKRRMADALAW
jgi:alkylation response protein AidB-like acyl-CoA dehydrogenase